MKKYSSALAYTARPYLEALVTRLAISYNTYATSSHEQTGDIITFVQFEERYLVENERSLVEYESILDSIDELYTENDSDDRSKIVNNLEDIRDVN